MTVLSSSNELADLIPLLFLTPDGLLGLEDGTLVRGIRLRTAVAPLRMSDDDMERTNRSVQELPSGLADGQSMQLLTTARPFDWVSEVERIQTANDTLYDALVADGLHDRAEALRRLALTGAQAIVQQADRQSAMELEHLIILPWRPRKKVGRSQQIDAQDYEETVEDLSHKYESLITHAETLGLEPERLDGREFFFALFRALNPGAVLPIDIDDTLARVLGGPYEIPEEASICAEDLRGLLCATAFDRSQRSYMEANGHIIQSRALASTPDNTWLGWLLHLTQSPYPFTLSVTWHASSRYRERTNAKRRYKRIYGLARSREMKNRAIDFEEQQREAEAANLTAELTTSAGSGVYQVSVNLSIMAPPDPTLSFRTEDDREDDLVDRAKRLERYTRALEQDVLQRTDARLHLSWFEQTAAFISTLPIGIDQLKMRRRYVTQNLADTIPIVSAHCGSPDGIVLGWEQPGRTAAKLDPYDPKHDNHVMIVAAKSGSGKTMVCNLILGKILPLGATGAVIDRAGHYEILARLIPGAVAVNLGADPDAYLGEETDPWKMPKAERPPAVNPWDVPNTRKLSKEKLRYLIALHSFILGSPQPDGSYDLSPTEKNLLSMAIRKVYRHCADTGQTPRERVLQRILAVEATQEHEDGNHETGGVLRRLSDGLHDYVGDGASAYLADWPTTVPEDSPLVIFDTRNISDDDAGAVMFTIVEYLQNQSVLAKHNKHRGPWAGRRFLVIDEGWKMFQSVTTGRWVNEQARRSRHHRLFLIGITQSLSDFTENPQGAALVSQSSIQLILKQQPEQAAHCKQHLRLTDHEEETISELKTVKGQYSEAYFINGRRGSGKIQIQAGLEEYWYATSEPDHDQPLRERVIAENNNDVWAALEELGRDYAPLAA